MPVVVHIHEVGDYPQQIRRGAELLAQGRLVVLPTETVYGAAADISQSEGRRRLRALRGGEARPFTVHLARREDASKYLDEVGELGDRMMKKLWPGPVGIMFDVPADRRRDVAAAHGLSESDLFEGSTITLRCPDHPVATDVLCAVGGPVALSMVKRPESSPNPAAWTELDSKVELVFDAGPTKYSKPSTLVRLKAEGYEIVREGIYDQRIIERLMRRTVLFVCSGNTCRSPMAEALARKLLAQRLSVSPEQLDSRGISVLSAGSFALPGARATPQAVEAMQEFGADLSRHRSRPLSHELINQADFIFTMSRNHTRDVIALVPTAAEKTAPLDPDADIEDPIGGDLSLYVELAKHLQELIEKRLSEKQLV